MATVTFEPINGGVPYKTAFFINKLNSLTSTPASSGTFTFSPQYTGESVVASTAVCRSYEVYIDKTPDGATDVVQSIANVTTDATNTAADLYLSAVTFVPGTTTASEALFTLQSLIGTVDVVIVLVADEA